MVSCAAFGGPADRRTGAADMVADNATQLLNIGRTYTVTRYIEPLGDTVETHEGLAIVHGRVSFVTGSFAEAEHALETAGRLDLEREAAHACVEERVRVGPAPCPSDRARARTSHSRR